MRVVFAANTLSFLLSYKLGLAKLLITRGYQVTFIGGDEKIPSYLNEQYEEMLQLSKTGKLEVKQSLKRGALPMTIAYNIITIAKLFTSKHYTHLVFHTATINLAAILIAKLLRRKEKKVSYFVSGFGPIRIRKAFKYRFGYRVYLSLLQLLAQERNARIFALNNYDHRLIQDFSSKTVVITVREFGSDEKLIKRLQERLSRENTERKIKELRCLFIGRTLLEKGVNETIEAIRIARSLGHNISLSIVGSHDIHNKSSVKLTNLIQKGESFINVYPDTTKLESIICDMDVFVSSSMREGHPKYLILSMSAGLIPLVYPSPGLTRDVIDGFNGIVTNRDSPESMAAELIKLYNSPDKARDMRFNILNYCNVYTQKEVDNCLMSKVLHED